MPSEPVHVASEEGQLLMIAMPRRMVRSLAIVLTEEGYFRMAGMIIDQHPEIGTQVRALVCNCGKPTGYHSSDCVSQRLLYWRDV